MHVAVDFKAGVPSVALLLPRVTVDILALVDVAHLELVRRPHAATAPVCWPERIAGPRDDYHSKLGEGNIYSTLIQIIFILC